uniref:Putative secreted protein n=1 Tax=Rhodopirellula TaxID=265488 RepID=UPI003971179B
GSGMPAFSWDTVPVYLHFGSPTKMTNEQVQTAARLSNFICLEKAHGRTTDREHPERIAAEDAQRIKTANPDAKVLMYWNTLIAWPFTSYNSDFAETHPENWTLRDRSTGEPLLKAMHGSTPVYQYNLLNPDVRKWWADTIGGAVNEFNFDGVFMDAVSQSKRPLWLQKGWGLDKADELDAAAVDMMRQTKAIIGNNRLLIYNGFRSKSGGPDNNAAAGTEFLPYSDGAQIEHFDQLSSITKEDMVAYWKMAATAAKDNKIVLYKAWPDHDINWLNRKFMSQSPAKKEAFAREKITYPLACYLIGAEENSYFCYGWGYGIDDGQLVDYPEYRKPLGAPKSRARRTGWIFRREFEHANVAVDLENRKARIQWLRD